MFRKILLLGFLAIGNQLLSQIAVFDEKFIHSSLNAKDYVLSKFKDHDIVILTERHHSDTTQYDLILEILKDPYFIENVGVIATEVGVKNSAKSINDFTHSTFNTEKEVRNSLKTVYRLTDYYVLWENHNYYQLLYGLYEINQKLKAQDKIKMFPLELEFSWNDCHSTEQYAASTSLYFDGDKDSLMTCNLLELFETHKLPKGKILVIQNTPHAFSGDRFNGGTSFYDYTKKKFRDRVCNLYLNSQIEWDKLIFMDALLQKNKVSSLGFDLQGTSIGKLDYFWRMKNKIGTFEEYFDGFVYYLNPLSFCRLIGIPEVMDDEFSEELLRRELITYPERAESATKENLRAYYDRRFLKHCFEHDSIKQQYENKFKEEITKTR